MKNVNETGGAGKTQLRKRRLSMGILLFILLLSLPPFCLPTAAQDTADDIETVRRLTFYQVAFTTLPFAFAVLYLILFIFFKQCKEHFYFFLFLFFYGVAIWFDYQHILFGGREGTLLYIRMHRAMIPVYSLFAMRFVYSLFYKKLPKQFWLFLVMFVISGISDVWVIREEHGIIFQLVMSAYQLELMRATVIAVYKKKEDAWLIAAGFFIFFFFSFFDSIMDSGGVTIFQAMENPYAIGTLGFMLTMSVALARNYSRTSEQLVLQERRAREKEMEQRLLEADNDRKTKELEEARKMQLSMLPSCVNDIPGLDICFSMTPAAEVGGDYYDYLKDEDGSLVTAVGDATGHGMKAGIMVAAVKSLFQTSGDMPDIPDFLSRCSAVIRQMNMKNMFMALMVLRIKDNVLTVSSAGMPHLLIARAASGEVEELVIKAPPLGAFRSFRYRMEETRLEPGDTVLMMSDGLPELFNEKDEMLGYDAVKETFKSSAHLESPTEIVNGLYAAGDAWRNGRAQDDDMTFVAIKVKPA